MFEVQHTIILHHLEVNCIICCHSEVVAVKQFHLHPHMRWAIFKVLEKASFEKLLVQGLEDLCGVEGIVIVKIVNLYPNWIGKEENVSEVHEKVFVNLGYPQKC